MLRPLILLALVTLLIPFVLSCESDGGGKAPASPSSSPTAETPAATAQPGSRQARASDPVYAYVDAIRADLSDGKALYINRVMRLSRDESAKFWPIYHDYEGELFALGDQRVEASREFVTAQADRSLDDKRASALADEWFKFESRRLELLRKYHDLIAKELSPVRAAQFTQIEHRVGTVIDLMIATELPLVQNETARASR